MLRVEPNTQTWTRVSRVFNSPMPVLAAALFCVCFFGPLVSNCDALKYNNNSTYIPKHICTYSDRVYTSILNNTSMQNVDSIIPQITVTSLNCNLLNMSSTGSLNHKMKMYGITRLRSDIIFLSDIRLSNSENVSTSLQASLSFRTNPYGSYISYFNSSMNRRGVGILLKNACSFLVLSEARDPGENCLFLRIKTTGTDIEFVVGSVYGPNRYEPAFFAWIRNYLSTLGNTPVVIGGDWNCTYCKSAANINPDVINMNNIPNRRHTDLLLQLCEDFNLCDPFRTLNPNRTEYTFVPPDTSKKNRSRIDFFIVSRSILNSVAECSISKGLQNKLFDHKAILLNCKKKLLSLHRQQFQKE